VAAEVAALGEVGADRHDRNGRVRVLRDADTEAHVGARRDAGGSGVCGFDRYADRHDFADRLDFEWPQDARDCERADAHLGRRGGGFDEHRDADAEQALQADAGQKALADATTGGIRESTMHWRSSDCGRRQNGWRHSWTSTRTKVDETLARGVTLQVFSP
jgi:hypothetical protein